MGDIKGKKMLHLQCHFGQDSISLARKGAEVTAVDLSRTKAIVEARIRNEKCGVDVNLQNRMYMIYQMFLEEKFDIVFTSYGVIGWLPDLDKWAKVICNFLNPMANSSW
ncbi:MAG: methyltransferase domain-containing protein [Cloacibacterium normanense]